MAMQRGDFVTAESAFAAWEHCMPSQPLTKARLGRSAPIAPVVGNAKRGSLIDDLVGPFARFLLVQTIPRLLVLGETKSVEVLVR